MSMRTSRASTDAEREQRREQSRQRLDEAARQLLSSDGWQRWVRVRAKCGLARLSLNNQLLVALSFPEATFVAGFKAWLRLGYCVRKGEKAIRIIAPMPMKTPQDIEGNGGDAGEELPRVLSKAVAVFDRSQVAALDGVEPTSLDAPCEPLTGNSHAHLVPRLRAFTESLGFTVSFEPIPGATGGWCDQSARRIVVDADQPPNARLRTLIHETIHALGVGYAEYGRERAEVIVDTATYVAAASVGLDVSGESVPYVAGWGETGALDAVTAFAGAIDELARRVESALAVEPTVENMAAVKPFAIAAAGYLA
jgi:hypothetical protein